MSAVKAVIGKWLGFTPSTGDSSYDILRFWFPELISNAILVVLPSFIGSWVTSQLGSVAMYGALGMGNNFLFMLTKMGEAIPVAAIAVIGRHNGAKEYEKCGEGLADTFWTTFLIGLIQYLFIFFGASLIFRWLGVPDDMIKVGVPFLEQKSFGFFLMFTTIGFIGFLRAIKNTQIPMVMALTGIGIFSFFDYSLVLGNFGFAKYGLYGDALATTIQYGVMNVILVTYIMFNPEYKKYFSRVFFTIFSTKRMLHLLNLSWPVLLDKCTFAFAAVWLSKMLSELGPKAIASFVAVRDLEKFAMLPTMASATVLTFLVSNRLGAKDYTGVSMSIRKILLLTSATVVPLLLMLSFKAELFIRVFDPKNLFIDFTSLVLPTISLLAIFDFVQIIFAAALRGAGDVRTVMVYRAIAVFLFMVPFTYAIHLLPMQNLALKFIVIYGSFYLMTGFMSIAYWFYMRSDKWKHRDV